MTHDLPIAFGRTVTNELHWGRISHAGASRSSRPLVAQFSGTLVAFLGVFGWGLFGSTIVPALAIGLNWDGATREGAIASIATGLLVTLAGRDARLLQVYSFPAGVAYPRLALVLVAARVLRRVVAHARSAAAAIDPDISIVMSA